MPTYGQRPQDLIFDSRGNALADVEVRIFATESDATSATGQLASVLTDAWGRWRYQSPLDEIWVRLPGGVVWPANANGRSAYEAALVNGFSGTEEEWLASLQGAAGPQGEAGPAGPEGPAGPAGPAGADGTAGTTSWDGITDKPTEFTPAGHTHTASEITDLDVSLRSTDANAFHDGSSYPLRSAVTTDALRRVRWIGPTEPTIGGGYATNGLDVWENTAP